jgi:alkylhydroperoxidase family enzyme
VRSVLAGEETDTVSKKDRALYSFIRKTVHDSLSIKQDDVDRVRAAGWSDSAIYDAITVCALFQFYNTWIDASGVQDMPASAYDMSGRRLATDGYARAETPVPR